MNPRLFNRFAMPGDGWSHFVPKGEFPWMNPENPDDAVIQVVDDEAVRLMAENFPDELFIDQDHLSNDLKNATTAMGWAYGRESASARADGLYVRPKWTDAGMANIRGGNVRYVSPVFDRESAQYLGIDARTGLPRLRVTRLLEAALTNRPNMRGVKPLSNRDGAGAPSGGEPGGGDDPAAATKENQTTTMKLVNRALDLSPDASEDAAIAGIEKLKKTGADAAALLATRDTELAEAKTQLANRDADIKQLKDQLAEREAAEIDAILDGAQITDEEPRKRWRSTLLANRETGKALLDDYVAQRKAATEAQAKAKGNGAPLTNRDAGTPDNPGNKGKDEPTGLDRTVAAFAKDKEGN